MSFIGRESISRARTSSPPMGGPALPGQAWFAQAMAQQQLQALQNAQQPAPQNQGINVVVAPQQPIAPQPLGARIRNLFTWNGLQDITDSSSLVLGELGFTLLLGRTVIGGVGRALLYDGLSYPAGLIERGSHLFSLQGVVDHLGLQLFSRPLQWMGEEAQQVINGSSSEQCILSVENLTITQSPFNLALTRLVSLSLLVTSTALVLEGAKALCGRASSLEKVKSNLELHIFVCGLAAVSYLVAG